MSKAHRALLLTLISIALPGVAWAQGTPLERKDVHLAVGGKASLYYLPLTIAEQLGYFKQEGLESRSATSPAGRSRCARLSVAAPTWFRAPMSTPSTCRRRSSR